MLACACIQLTCISQIGWSSTYGSVLNLASKVKSFYSDQNWAAMLFQNFCVVSSLVFFHTATWKECWYQMQWFYSPYRTNKHESVLGLALFFLPALFLNSAMTGSFSLLISSPSIGLLILFFASPCLSHTSIGTPVSPELLQLPGIQAAGMHRLHWLSSNIMGGFKSHPIGPSVSWPAV